MELSFERARTEEASQGAPRIAHGKSCSKGSCAAVCTMPLEASQAEKQAWASTPYRAGCCRKRVNVAARAVHKYTSGSHRPTPPSCGGKCNTFSGTFRFCAWKAVTKGEFLHCALLLDYVPPKEPPSTPLGNPLRIRRPKLPQLKKVANHLPFT